MPIALSIGVQRMVRSDLASSGVMFTLDTDTGFRDVVLINASYGLGETVVQGFVTPDECCVFKPPLQQDLKPIIRKSVGSKEFKLVYDEGGSRAVKTVPVAAGDRARYALADDEILRLARWGCAIETHYSRARGMPTPMDIEWAKDGRTGELFIVQARPETVHARAEVTQYEHYRLRERGPVLVTGRSIGAKIATGPVRIIPNAADLRLFEAGEVLVTDKTDPDWEPIMKKAAAIVTNRGGRTCHAAIVSRELGVPAVVGTETGTAALMNGQVVTVSCAEGDTGFVYAGAHPFDIERVDLSALHRPRTSIMMNVANPDEAFALSFIPNDGVGLARLEFIRHEHALELYMTVEIPSNVVLLPDFSEYFDGFSIGSNDLTQLTLGVDRDSEIVAHVFDERDKAVRALIAQAIHQARRLKRKIGLCGQAPSDYPDFAKFLVECGIDSMSLNPDAVLPTTQVVVDAEGATGHFPDDAKESPVDDGRRIRLAG